MTNSTSRPGEFALIAELFAPLAGTGAFGLKDDIAVISPAAGHELVVTTDTIIEGIDFFAGDPADTVAKKALRVNLSDLCAKGAKPRAYLLTLSLPVSVQMPWLRDFARGLEEDQKQCHVVLIGGDLSATPGPLAITIAAFGEAPTGKIVRRQGAHVGDNVYVTGTIGDSGAGLSIVQEGKHVPELIHRYRVPEPPLDFGPSLMGLASASLDVSDGLIADLGHLAEASGVGIDVEAGKIPLSQAVRELWGTAAPVRAATAGDDYQVAFTAPAHADTAILKAAARCGVRATRIGIVVADAGVRLLDDRGQAIPLECPGYQHF